MASDFELSVRRDNGIRAVLHLTGDDVSLLIANLEPRVQGIDPDEVRDLRRRLARWVDGLK